MGRSDFPCEIRQAHKDEWQDAMSLAWRTFLRFEAKDYTPQGIKSFEDFVTDSGLRRMFLAGSYEVTAAFDKGRMIGMISVRGGSHISLLFVEAAYHRRGVGRALVRHVCNYLLTERGVSVVTVNAAPYAVGFYHKIGFCDTGLETWKGGVLYTPMELAL